MNQRLTNLKKIVIEKAVILYWLCGGMWIANLRCYLIGHSAHWKDREEWLNKKGQYEMLQRFLAIISLIAGSIMAVTHTDAGSQIARILDLLLGPLFVDLRRWVPCLPAAMPHQVFGLGLVGSSIALIVGVYEWPLPSDRKILDPNGIAAARLLRLLRMHLAGHLMAFIYWGSVGILALFANPVTVAPYISLFFCYTHHILYRRINSEFVRERNLTAEEHHLTKLMGLTALRHRLAIKRLQDEAIGAIEPKGRLIL